MIIPIRCFTCGKVLADIWEKYVNLIKEEHNYDYIFKILNIKRFCCRRMIITHVNTIDDMIKYNENIDNSANILNNELIKIDLRNNNLNIDDAWGVINNFIKNKGLIAHHLNSYNQFIESDIQNIINNTKDIVIVSKNIQNNGYKLKIVITFGKIYFKYPMIEDNEGNEKLILPNYARNSDSTYSSKLYVDVSRKMYNVSENNGEMLFSEDMNNVYLGKIPTMLKSKYCTLTMHQENGDYNKIKYEECPYDQGGYFIVNGKEKTLVIQEGDKKNTVNVYQKNDSYSAEIHSRVENTIKVKSLYTVLKQSNLNESVIRIMSNSLTQDIPVMILFNAMGILDKEKILEYISYSSTDYDALKILNNSFNEVSSIDNQNMALEYLSKLSSISIPSKNDRIKFAENFLINELLPHVSITNYKNKPFFLGYIIKQLIETKLGNRIVDDRDNFINKRLQTSGDLMRQLFKELYTQVINEGKNYIQNIVDNVDDDEFTFIKVFKSEIITDGFKMSLGTGNWTSNMQFGSKQVGVAQILKRLSNVATVTHLRTIINPADKDSKISDLRLLHNTYWGMCCPVETPEGRSSGLVKNLAFLSQISLGNSTKTILDFLQNYLMECLENVSPSKIFNLTKIFINGDWIGVIDNTDNITYKLRNLRRSGNVPAQTSITFDKLNNEIRIFTDKGRIYRPLYIVDENNELIIQKSHIVRLVNKDDPFNWNDLLSNGLIEYIDIEEEEETLIAMVIEDLEDKSKQFTHCEIHPSMILGVAASIIPFSNHNPSPRNVFECAMSKQSLGMFSTNFQQRFDSVSYVMFYPQKPLVGTKPMNYFNFDKLPAGHNCIVGINCYTGFKIGPQMS